MNVRYICLLLTFLLPSSALANLKAAQAALTAKDYDRAFTQYSDAAQKGNSLAQFTVGLFFYHGWGRPQALENACGWFEKSAKGAIPYAAHLYAQCLEQGVRAPANPAKAAEWYRKAASLGHHISLCDLALLHIMGSGVDKNPAKGLALCRQAAERGSSAALVRLVGLYLSEDPDIRNVQAAHQLLTFRLEKNDPQTQYYWGLMARDGLVAPASSVQARRWFEAAASQHFSPAYLPTGKLYLAVIDAQTGHPPADALAKAYLWLSAAANSPQTQAHMAEIRLLLSHVKALMPQTWKPELDEKVAAHLKTK